MNTIDVTYRRRPPNSRPERLLTWLLAAAPLPHEQLAARIDFELGEDVDVRPT